jgi:hypothetical protein
MKNIEKSLTNYVQGTGPYVSRDTLCSYAEKDADDIINILFNLVNNELDCVDGTGSLDRVIALLDYVKKIVIVNDDANRKKILRRLRKLIEKIDRVKVENKNKFNDINKAFSELDRVLEEIGELEMTVTDKNTNQYDFINYLVGVIKNVSYIEYTLIKMPQLVNCKDKKDVSLFRNVLNKYLVALNDDNNDEISYYSNLISLILSRSAFELKDSEKRNCLNDIYKCLNKLCVTKKSQKANKKKIEWLNNLILSLKCNNEKESNIELIANKYHIDVVFPEHIKLVAHLAKVPKTGEMVDRELIDDYIISIDKQNAKEIDDALSCTKLSNGNYLLGVHIASILGYFPYESSIVDEAINRREAIYLPTSYQDKVDDFNKTIPILPYEFSANTGSLVEGEHKLARSYYFELDSFGNIINERFIKSIITNSHKSSYNEIDKVLKKGSENPKLNEIVNNLKEVTKILEKKYKGTDFYESFKENTIDSADLRLKKDGSQKLVYYPILLTGNRVAEFFYKNNYPCLYRVHEVNEENLAKLQAMVDGLAKEYGGEQYQRLFRLIEGIYPKGWYDIKGPHQGLGLEHYCHCTSGLRRAADIVVEHALEVCYDKTPTEKELFKLAKEIEDKKEIINSKQNTIDWFVKDYERTYQKKR